MADAPKPCDPNHNVGDANYYPPETKHNPTQVEVEQSRATAMNDHLDAIKSQERR